MLLKSLSFFSQVAPPLITGVLGFTLEVGITLRLCARFTCSAAAHLWESKLSSDHVISEDREGWVRIEATVADTDQLRWWLLGFGAQVEVLGPEELREEIKEIVFQQGGLYTRNVSI